MKIEIDNKYLITSDSRNIILQEKKISKGEKTAGEEYFDVVGYYASLEMLFQSLFRLKVRHSTSETLKELHEDIILAKREICMAFEGV